MSGCKHGNMFYIHLTCIIVVGQKSLTFL